jgi:dinuclear metal center YbgI/SA1388 family protein
MPQLRELTNYLEILAPAAYQESYDNSGLLVGDPTAEITGVLVSLDATEAVIDEALAKSCNVVVSHHPIVFRGLKKLTGRTYVERTVVKAIKNDVALYAIHTNLDNVVGGVNFMIAEKLGLQNVRILAPKSGVLTKLVVFVPAESTSDVLNALYEAGAGQIGNYDRCSFRTEGTGTFRPLDGANPAIGSVGDEESVAEHRLEVIFPSHLEHAMVTAMKRTHPYEEVAYDLYALNNQNQTVGSGAVGDLPASLHGREWLHYLKHQMGLSVIRHTTLLDKPIRRVAVCGGAGGFLLNDAIRAGAEVFVTADYKYHEFFDADDRITICDVGHYESEAFTKDLLQQHLAKKFTTFAVILSETTTNPVNYFY